MQRRGKAFAPFCVSIFPNWYPLLSDFVLVSGEEEWARLSEAINNVPLAEFNMYRSGIQYTVLSPASDDGLRPKLIYWDNRKRFVTGVEFSESIVEIEYEPGMRGEHPFFRHPRWANLPEVYFKQGTEGYELGLEVQEDCWKHIRETGKIGELCQIKSHTDHSCGTTRLVIATLPHGEFGSYYQNTDYDRWKALRDARDEELEAKGWKRKIERDGEIQDPWTRVEHKYFTVSHRDI